ncbi:GLPGLI family protein [Flavivirga spongiicola]|uniref:GLPGLI family protein n=1 Tax=Flavivirga spongiicola TaxID=421621 RepID=A0ABU7XRF9_9FLAO|nr:GLPGLI family protein [Flavivirga sp. MEBiC05379]MDO5978350.1 GLPGLI family protein [Flavivirga sp. MEBiC05379]
MKQLLVVLLAFLFSNSTVAQDFQGIATYKTKRQLDVKLDSTQMNSEMHQRMIAMLKKQFEKTYILTFNKEASIYKEDEKLEAPQTAGVQMLFVSADGSDILYRNIKENRFTSQNEVFGKIFLIKDVLKKEDWTLESETKNIGDYTCYKATTKRVVEVVESGISVNGDKDLDAGQEEEPQMEEITITAWYTLQIPVNTGPAGYYGLPGLILEVHDGQETIICSKVVLNPKNKVAIKEPTKGKEITQEKFEEVVEKRMQEERERYNPDRNSGDSERIEIRIGG